MSTAGELMSNGMPAPLAVQIGSRAPAATKLVATGTTKAGALALVSPANIFGTVTSGSASACALPNAAGSADVYIYNGGAGGLLVFTGNTTDAINTGSAGASYTVPAGKCGIFRACGSTWLAANG